MRHIIFLALLFLPLFAFGDTIATNYSVSLRGKVIANYSSGQIIRVIMKADSVASFDTIKVNVSNDHPCGKCTYSLLIFGPKGPIVIDTTQKTEDFYIVLAPLVANYRQTGTKSFHGYYTEYYEDPSKSRVVSFEIRLQ